MSEVWTQSFEVRSYETDATGRLSVSSLCDYCQEAAGVHSLVSGVSIGDLGRSNLTWVLGRLELRIERLPRWRDVVTVTTWPSRHRSFFVVRDFLIEGAEAEVLARATSTWFVIDLERRKAARVPAAVLETVVPDRPRAMQESWSKLAVPARIDRSSRFPVRYGDLDENAHVNHVRYLDWSLESLDPDFYSGRRLSELAIDFLAERTYGDTVVVETQLLPGDDETTVLFSIKDESDGAEAARLRSRWVAR